MRSFQRWTLVALRGRAERRARPAAGALSALCAIAALCGLTPTAKAQDPPDPTEDADHEKPAEVVAPRVLEWVDADYPPDALASRIEATVVLRLTVDRDGQVTEAQAVEPAGHGFDEAAVAAVRKFRFEPARRAGTPVGARILFRYTFNLPEAPAAPPPGPAEGAPAPPGAPPPSRNAPVTAPKDAERATPRQPVEVTVRGRQSEAQRRRDSAEAVTVIETYRARQQTRDLGEVLSSVEGVSVRRAGGLGSRFRFSLNGLYDEQIRFYFDEVPLDIAGYSFGAVSVPVDLVDRVEIYRGVLPIRFGADALGGAVNLVPDKRYETRLSASYQRGSFGTHRVWALGRYRHAPSGLFAGASGWFDNARNDYDIEVDVPDKSGRSTLQRVRRFHDAYKAYGGVLELGAVETPWASRLLVNLFGATFRKEVQHNVYGTMPFGEAEYGETTFGGTARYEHMLRPDLSLSVVASGARRTIEFHDVSDAVYDWYGNVIGARRTKGEVTRRPRDSTLWQHNAFGRAQIAWRPAPKHALRLASTGRFFTRKGDERGFKGPGGTNPLAAREDLFTLMSAVEYELNAFGTRSAERTDAALDPSRDNRLQNTVFAKHYFWSAAADNVLVASELDKVDFAKHFFGIGDGVRFRFTDWLTAKASYELATRLPNVDELYGDGVTIYPNVSLEPETSHNANLGVRVEVRPPSAGRVIADMNGFVRVSDGLIRQQPDDYTSSYRNVASARAGGFEGSLSWSSPDNWVLLDGNATWQDIRNTATDGPFAEFNGDRIPNQPWLFANWSGRLQWRGVMMPGDELSPYYYGRYVHEFFRTWESIGDRQFKATIPTQVAHRIGLTYSMRGRIRTVVTVEVDNMLDAKLYDFFGAQKPGRSVALKVAGEL